MHGYRALRLSRRHRRFAAITVPRTTASPSACRATSSKKLSLTANYTFAKAQTWGCILGELFDYVNGVCDPFNAFAPGDYGPSGEDVRHRAVLAGTYHAPLGLEFSTITQVESARPYTLTNADGSGRAVINGVETISRSVPRTPLLSGRSPRLTSHS